MPAQFSWKSFRRSLPWRQIAGWTIFAAAFGYTEAMLVVYLRRLLGESIGLDYRQIFEGKGVEFSSASIAADMRRHHVWNLERSREIATLLLLLGAAWGGGRTRRERVAVFLYTFAVWDETYYFFLLPWTGFPHSLTAIDIYFLVPLAWYGPVWFPILLVMPCLIAGAFWLWRTEDREDEKEAPQTVALPK